MGNWQLNGIKCRNSRAQNKGNNNGLMQETNDSAGYE